MLFKNISAQSKQEEIFSSGSHLRACGCSRKVTIWNSLKGLFLPTCLFCLNATLYLCVASLQGCLLLKVSDFGVFFYANCGCSVGGAHSLTSSKCCWEMLIGSDRWWGFCGRSDRRIVLWQATDFKVCAGVGRAQLCHLRRWSLRRF